MLKHVHSEGLVYEKQAFDEPESQEKARCFNGVDTSTKKDALYWTFNENVYPGLADAFFKNDSFVLIFNIKPDWCSTCSSNNWAKAVWECKFEFSDGRVVPADHINIILDPHGHTLIATCTSSELQKSILENTIDMGQAYKATISAFLTDQMHFEYTNIEFCLYPSLADWQNNNLNNNKNRLKIGKIKPITLAACTMVRTGWHSSFEQIVEWIIYHLNIGFQHFYFYPDGASAEWRCSLQPFIDLGIVEIVEWSWPENGFIHQQAQQNSCIYRYREIATFVGLHDVDEFFQPLNNSSSLVDLESIVAEYPDDLGALQVRSIYFGSEDINTSAGNGQEMERKQENSADSPPPNESDTGNISLYTEKYVHREAEAIDGGHQKCLVRPENVLTFSVHMITSGNTMVVPDPNIFRVAHVKPQMKFIILDESLKSYSSDIKLKIRKYYPDGLPSCN